jgi:hypothetical protein
MPEGLWKEAAHLARLHGVNPIARALRLDYYSLKHHVKTAAAEAPTRPAFVEVSVVPPVLPSDCIVEMERSDGGRMRAHLSRPEDLVAVTELFWRCRA